LRPSHNASDRNIVKEYKNPWLGQSHDDLVDRTAQNTARIALHDQINRSVIFAPTHIKAASKLLHHKGISIISYCLACGAW